ncbi:MAG: recombinase RecT, partial [Clostridium sp.]
MTDNKQLQTKQQNNITDSVLVRIKEFEKGGDIAFPPNYNYANALKSAQLILTETVDKNKQPVLQTCTKASICNALLDMTIQGLSPAKKQCYFVPYGGKLQLMKSYLGNIAATKRLKGVKDVFANIIWEGDEFEYKLNLETGLIEIVKHEQKFENI